MNQRETARLGERMGGDVCEPHLAEGGSKDQGIRVAAPRSHSLEELRCHLCLPGSEPTFPPHSAPSSQWALVSGSASPSPNGLLQTVSCRHERGFAVC